MPVKTAICFPVALPERDESRGTDTMVKPVNTRAGTGYCWPLYVTNPGKVLHRERLLRMLSARRVGRLRISARLMSGSPLTP